jgi:hypothetical protein
VALRLAAPGLAALALALVLWLGEAGGPYSLVLLAAIVAGAARLLAAVGDVVDARTDRFPVVMSAAGLASLVAAGAAHVPLLAVGLFACAALELLGSGSSAVRSETAAEPLSLHETPVSRAA